MPISDLDFTFKFFHPPHRTVPFHNGLLDTRTKHTVAQDRLVVAEQRILDIERRKSASNLQTLIFEQKQFEKKLASFHYHVNSISIERPTKMRDRSSSEIGLPPIRPSSPLSGSLPNRLSKLSVSLNDSKQNLLVLPKCIDSRRRFSAYSDGDASENSFFTTDMESAEEEEDTETERIRSVTMNPKTLAIRRDKPLKLVKKPNKLLLPIVSIIPPEEDVLFLTQNDCSDYR
ncbi:hypothetical protein I4U23_028215 [Adineta vaga]|nr:hypothetical protein I4U23_028215 [Adineta vaga]